MLVDLELPNIRRQLTPPYTLQGSPNDRELDVGAGRARDAVVPVLQPAVPLLRHRGAAAPSAARVRARRSRGVAQADLLTRTSQGK